MSTPITAALTRPGNVVFPSNLPYVRDLAAAGGHVVRQPSGHLVFYQAGHRRFLATDPEGNPLHECEWAAGPDGRTRLARARLRLDWGQWIGIKPEGLVNSITLDLSRKPGWQQLTPDDLRRMAARTMGVPLEEVRFFYRDEDLTIDRRGQATIRHKKDAFYVLEKDTFDAAPEQVRFMSCMGAMHWDRIDFLPVVELFQSLLPGTGSAAFELIRGLYDDQNEGQPVPLRYRGIPTYPSEAAFRLFSSFFVPRAPGGGDPFPLFMDPPRSCEVEWLPAPEPPVRYFDTARNLCITIKGGMVQKITLADDPSGLPYVRPDRNGFAPCNRTVVVREGKLVLQEGQTQREMSINPAWGPLRESPHTASRSYTPEWRDLFWGSVPQVAPARAFASVLLYPDDDREIEEASSQPFVADYLQDLLEQDATLADHLARSEWVLIHNFDAAVNTYIGLDRPRTYTILYRWPEYAQKQAQIVWNRLAQLNRLEWARQIAFVPVEAASLPNMSNRFHLVFQWIPFIEFNHHIKLQAAAKALRERLAPGGRAFVVGPPTMKTILQAAQIRLLQSLPVDTLPTFHMHRTILPQARLRAELTLISATNP